MCKDLEVKDYSSNLEGLSLDKLTKLRDVAQDYRIKSYSEYVKAMDHEADVNKAIKVIMNKS